MSTIAQHTRGRIAAGEMAKSTGRALWPWLVTAALLFGCKTVPDDTYFTMAYTLLPAARESNATVPVTLRVRELEIIPAYDQQRLVYRYSPYQFQYYSYMLWAVKPQQMLTDLMMSHLEQVNLFRSVNSDYGDVPPDYELSGRLLAIEELDSGDEWYAHLAFTLRLTRYRGEQVVWSRRVDAKKKVYNKSPVYVVKALSDIMEEEMGKIVTELRAFFASQPADREGGR